MKNPYLKKCFAVGMLCLILLSIPVSSANIKNPDSFEPTTHGRGWVFLLGLIFKPEIKDGIVDCIAIRLRFSVRNLTGGFGGICGLERVYFEEGAFMGKFGLVRFVCRFYYGNFTIDWDEIPGK
ncbi:MAG: hypothetical protein JSW06_01160 [Thermoplasmatales archaeon]|nr:MAG: hypothetical protein JSW06_01160 [Thermoplasmatales archaeon]